MRLANLGPIWKRKLVEKKLFGTYQTCDRRIQILEEDGLLLHSRRAQIGDGRRTTVWFNRSIADQMIQHETEVMKVFFAYYPCIEARTGADVDQRYKSDMDAVISGLSYRVEVDRDTERLHQVRNRLKVYDNCNDPVLFITTTDRRKKEVLREIKNPKIYFCTMDALLGDPWGEIWVNCLGEVEAVFPAEEGAVELGGSSASSCPC